MTMNIEPCLKIKHRAQSARMKKIGRDLLFQTATKELYREYQRRNIERKIGLAPCLIQIVDSRSFWGKWNPQVRTISIAAPLIEIYPWHDVIGVLRHEMAHQYVDEQMDSNPQKEIHGDLFKKACDKVGVPSFYVSAAVHLQQNTLDWRQTQASSQEETLIEKVRKLLNLAQSTNEHEAALAMNRVQEIYARYNLEKWESGKTSPEFYHHFIRPGRKRLHTFEQKMMSILVNHYFVEVIVGNEFDLSSQSDHRVVELIGTKENVLMADYVYEYLDRICHDLAAHKRKDSSISLSSKSINDFKMGLLVGFDEKLNSFKTAQKSGEIDKSLLLFKKNPFLKSYISKIHPRLVSVTSKSSLRDRQFFEEGRAEGRKLNIQRPMENKKNQKNIFFLK